MKRSRAHLAINFTKPQLDTSRRLATVRVAEVWNRNQLPLPLLVSRSALEVQDPLSVAIDVIHDLTKQAAKECAL